MTDPPVTPDPLPLADEIRAEVNAAFAQYGSAFGPYGDALRKIASDVEARLRALQAERDDAQTENDALAKAYKQSLDREAALRAEVARLQGANANVTRELRAMQVELHRTAPKAGA